MREEKVITYIEKALTVIRGLIACFTVVALGRYVCMNNLTMVAVMFLIHGLLLVAVHVGRQSRCYILMIAAGIVYIVVGSMNSFTGISAWALPYYLVAALSILGGLAGYYVRIRKKEHLRGYSWRQIFVFVLVLALVGGAWLYQNHSANAETGYARRSVWGVPDQYDEKECPQEGNVTKVTYETKAYATDERSVGKACNVYLPYGYDETKQYDILYLMHGTGDDEDYWLIKNDNNKTMVDNLIYSGEIEPLIIVTPTWYVEDDCSEDLDQLTYSFAQELRNDLMPTIESQYSTYAEDVSEEAFKDSREHRAFAGLSRGSVTMYHAAMQQNLDVFAWFGGFSAARITEDEWTNTAMSEELGQYPISYLYVTTGTSDMAAQEQLKRYDMLLSIDTRLTEGVNTSFDVFPMRYHSAGSWHLALYNYLQKIF